MSSWCYFCVVSLVIYTVTVAQDPILRLDETTPKARELGKVYAVKDEDVTISCFVENLPKDSLVKFRRAYGKSLQETEQISSDESVFDNTRYGIEKPTPSTWRLRVRNIPTAYEGEYICFVSKNIDSEWQQSVKVFVYAYPVLNPAETSADITVKQGDTVELQCSATGIPEPTIRWERQGNALLPVGQETFFGSKMLIPNIQSNHRGVYKCSAFNIMGTIQRDIEVKVMFKPIIQVTQQNVQQAPGYVMELQCLIEGNPEPSDSELSWYQGAVGMSKSSGRYELRIIRGAFQRLTYELIINGVQDEDYGDYRCQAQNDLGNSYGYITLSKTDVPQKSLKFGVVIKASAVIPCSSLWMVLFLSLLALYFTRL